MMGTYERRGGITMWTCPKCRREFKKQNQDHYCGKAPKTIDEYIAGQPEKCQPYLNELREAIQAAIPEAVEAFREQLSDYKTSKGAIHLLYDKPLPIELIKTIVKWCYETGNHP